jgi:hypothetical protein
MHLGARTSAENKFKRLVQWILKKPDCYAIGLGDYADLITRQDLRRFTGTVNKEDLMQEIDSLVNNQRDMIVHNLKPLADAGKLLGLAEGNHEESIKKHYSFDVMKDVCKTLGVPNLGYSFFYRMAIKKGTHNVIKNVIIYGSHGFSSSRRGGAAMNKRELIMANYDADIILMAHDHHKFGRRFIRLGITEKGEPRLIKKPVIIAATGSFKKTLVEGHTTWEETRGFPPNDIGVVRININIKQEGGEDKLDMHISE